MRYVLVCPDDLLRTFLPPTPGFAPVYVVATPAARARIVRQGGEAHAGDLATPAVYRRAFRSGHEPVVVAVKPPRRARVLAAIREKGGLTKADRVAVDVDPVSLL